MSRTAEQHAEEVLDAHAAYAQALSWVDRASADLQRATAALQTAETRLRQLARTGGRR